MSIRFILQDPFIVQLCKAPPRTDVSGLTPYPLQYSILFELASISYRFRSLASELGFSQYLRRLNSFLSSQITPLVRLRPIYCHKTVPFTIYTPPIRLSSCADDTSCQQQQRQLQRYRQPFWLVLSTVLKSVPSCLARSNHT